jgi:hypothetical protein
MVDRRPRTMRHATPRGVPPRCRVCMGRSGTTHAVVGLAAALLAPLPALSTPVCDPEDGHTEFGILEIAGQQDRLIRSARKVCVVARVENAEEDVAYLADLTSPEQVVATSGWVDLSRQSEEVRGHLLTNCKGTPPAGSCVVAVYGTVTAYPSWGGQFIIVPDEVRLK